MDKGLVRSLSCQTRTAGSVNGVEYIWAAGDEESLTMAESDSIAAFSLVTATDSFSFKHATEHLKVKSKARSNTTMYLLEEFIMHFNQCYNIMY